MCAMMWNENWMNGCSQRVVSSGTKSSWRQDASGVSQGSVLKPIFFNIFIDDLNHGAEYTLRQLGDHAKLREVADTPHECAAIQSIYDRLESWAERNRVEFNKGKSEVLPLAMNNPSHCFSQAATWLESSFKEKNLEVMVDT